MFYHEKRRSPRYRVLDNSTSKFQFQIDGQTYEGKLYDYSRFGVGVILDSQEFPMKKKEYQVNHCKIIFNETIRELGNARLVRMSLENGKLHLGIFLESEFIDMDLLHEKQILVSQEDEIKRVILHLSVKDSVSLEFMQFASKFQYGLSLYKIALDELDKKFEKEPKKLQDSLFKAITQGIGKKFYDFLTDSIEELKVLTQNYNKHQNEVSGFFLRKSIFQFILESEFLKRTNLRPKGYAGDAVMMEMLYRNEYLGKSSFGKIFHKHPIETSAADAVRNRRRYIDQLINLQMQSSNLQDFKVLSVACGPAWEIQDFFISSPYKEYVKFYLLDQDEDALAEAKKRIGMIEKGRYLKQCEFVHESVRTILKNRNPAIVIGKFDFIYSMGLYDYLAFAVAKVLTEKLYSMLKEGGILVIGNYHEKNETRKYMEYVMDWVLYYRDEHDMLELTENLVAPSSVNIEFEDSGNQMFMKIIK
ncbi:MAG: class I SAM-dependent methyltransferase [Leptospiraceae bacterium]|nr:class I SAM-dependent methyltransferase [Leptospiraceae bacterium]